MGKQQSQNNNNDLPPEQIYCRKEACAIQYCLNRFDHQQNKCQDVIETWEKCRDKARANAAAATSNSNSGASTTKL